MTGVSIDEAARRAGTSIRERRNPMVWVDPVCAMSVEARDAPRLTFNGVEYRFCSEMCCRAFGERPGRYLKNGDNPRFENLDNGLSAVEPRDPEEG